ncbi:MAG TPA: nitroreductase [Parvibaculum sp.]
MSRSQETLDLLLTRRSVKPAGMAAPGPTDADLELILRAGARVPDHAKLVPWRFITFRGETRRAFGEVLKNVFARNEPRADADRLALEGARLLQVPVVVAVISRIVPHKKAPEWEQVLSAGASCQNMLVAATALGYASTWVTEWYAYDADVARALGLAENERVAGFIYFGTATGPKDERDRPNLADITQEWKPAS